MASGKHFEWSLYQKGATEVQIYLLYNQNHWITIDPDGDKYLY